MEPWTILGALGALALVVLLVWALAKGGESYQAEKRYAVLSELARRGAVGATKYDLLRSLESFYGYPDSPDVLTPELASLERMGYARHLTRTMHYHYFVTERGQSELERLEAAGVRKVKLPRA